MINKIKKINGLTIRVSKGFTLIETLVAVLILSTAIAGPLTIASKGLNAALVAKNQITGYYLAQDGLEFVRFVRDSNKLKEADWLTGAGGTAAGIDLTPCVGVIGCYVDSTLNNPVNPTACNIGSPTTCTMSTPTTAVKNFYYDGANERFTYNSSGTKRTIFSRKISITDPVGSPVDEKIVTVTVYWIDVGSIVHTVTLQENMFNWQ